MRLRKAELVDILAFVMIFTMFAGFIAAFVFNNSTQDRRGFVVDAINKEAMRLQASLEGYSKYSNYCFMYEDGKLITDSNKMENIKNTQIQLSVQKVKEVFNTPRMAKMFKFNDGDGVVITIQDEVGYDKVASVNIEVNYTARFRTPYLENDDADGSDSSTVKGYKIKDTTSRTIENPIRAKNKINNGGRSYE